MALTTARINEIRDEMERTFPLSREDREELFMMALTQAAIIEGTPAVPVDAPAPKKARVSKAADPAEAPADDTTA